MFKEREGQNQGMESCCYPTPRCAHTLCFCMYKAAARAGPTDMSWWQNASAAASRPAASRFILSGQVQSFASLLPASLPADSALLNASLLLTHSSIRDEQSGQWDRVARLVSRRRQLRVAILGCSTSVGCGSADPSARCDASRGWPRLFHDAVQAQLQEKLPGWAYGTHTRVTAKNAVDPTYFAQCTTGFVDESTHVVMVEFFTNLFGVFKQGNHTGLDGTVEAIRMAAPNAAVVFVVWLKELTSHVGHLRSFIQAVARRQSADIVDVPVALLHLASKHQLRATSWYAKGGKDHHPNGAGHWMLGSATAHLVADRLAQASPARAVMSGAAAKQASELYCADCAARGIVKKQECFNNADQLPLQVPLKGSWALVDEGGDKGVSKQGYVSTTIGDAAELLLASSVCPAGNGLVRLGYHLSTRPGQGALQLSCSGCSCTALQGILAPVSPFPIVQTDVRLIDSRYFSLPGQNNGSLSVTASTTFSFGPINERAATRCVLRVEHVRSGAPRSEKSRVRLDSMAVSIKCPPLRPSKGTSPSGKPPKLAAQLPSELNFLQHARVPNVASAKRASSKSK